MNGEETRTFSLNAVDRRLDPRHPVVDQSTGQAISDAIIMIERSKTRAQILGVQNWEKQKFGKIIYNDREVPVPNNEVAFNTESGRAYSKPKNGYTYDNGVIVEGGTSDDMDITKAMGDVYIFVHDLDTRMVSVYKRTKCTMKAVRLNAVINVANLNPGGEFGYGRDMSYHQINSFIVH